MKRLTLSQALVLCLATLIVALSGCAGPQNPTNYPRGGRGMMGGAAPTTATPGGGPGGGVMGGNNAGSTSYSSDGQRIFMTGIGIDGQDITRTAPRVSQGALMMGGGGCASCHAPNGRGATIRMMTGTAIKAPDIRYRELIKAGFTDTTIRGAIRNGLDEAGKPLNVAMPRWQMTDAELDATIAYLKVLGAQ